MAKACWSKKMPMENDVATSKSEEEWDVEAWIAIKEEEIALTTSTTNQINYKNGWIVDSSYSNHMTGGKEKLHNLSESKGSRVVVTASNSKLPITLVGDTTVPP
ncbi:hypothetical protein CRG98_016316 [Punica granatum]|uniref:Retrovirus-related Pol polyprotein from transposon TNT 1-94-like beta-barrel domain-containing protein n=1 Tax=Punica granatum TaxID=22663 RepID=A0A2I0K451_PUNGR|nr:hypothetical protein CRG98_016316 [Punica granatum]